MITAFVIVFRDVRELVIFGVALALFIIVILAPREWLRPLWRPLWRPRDGGNS
jgi:hypothetical protein